jgi:hypothetical protein
MNSTFASIQLALFLVICVWTGFLSYLLFKTIGNYNRLTKGITQETLSDVLKKLLDHEEKTLSDIKKIFSDIEAIKRDNTSNIQKYSLVRYNPFADTGGDQSFSLVLLDGLDNGYIITSLFARTGVRWYIKSIKKGKPVEHELSDEEKQALKKAKD